jgi:clan AA aspartic protease
VSAQSGQPKQSLLVWIDTAFNGGLVIPNTQIEALGLKKASSVEAILADGQLTELPTYNCVIDWFGNEYHTQVVANEGRLPLLGTMLLDQHRLIVDYASRTLILE